MTCLLQLTFVARAISFAVLGLPAFAAAYAETAEFNVASPKWGTRIEATSTFDARFDPYKVADGAVVHGDAWLSADNAPLPQSIVFRFEREFMISRIRLIQTEWNGLMYRTRNFEIQVAADKDDWRTVASGTLDSKSGSVRELTFKTVLARSLRVVITSSYNFVQTCGMAEVEIFSVLPANTQPPYNEATKMFKWKTERGIFNLNIEMDPPTQFWTPIESPSKDDLAQEYRSSQYQLKFNRQSRREKTQVLNFEITRMDGKPFGINEYKLECKTSFAGVYKLFIPGRMAQQSYGVDLPFQFAGHSSAVLSTPVVWMQQTDGRNTLAIGLIDQVPTTHISGSTHALGNGGEAQGFANTYVRATFTRKFPSGKKTNCFRDGIYINANPEETWFDALNDFAAAVDEDRGFAPRPIGKYSLNSMWHSWYAHADRINDEQIRDDVEKAAELGIETVQFDAGWNVPWNPGYALAREGDYIFDSGRFPDPVGLIDDIHKKGIHVILHVAPLLMGQQSKAYATMKDCLLLANGKEDAGHHLDPRLKKTHNYLLAAWEKMILEYKIDGLWYDFLEIPEAVDPPVDGRETIEPDLLIAYSRLLKSLYERALELNPDFIIIMRRESANLNAKLYCTHVWPFDVPQDYNMNRRDVMFMKTYGTGILTHACCTSWAISESDDNVARQMASITLAGVPAFSIKLAESPASHNAIIKAWLSYYKENKEALMLGTMTPLLPTPPSAALRIEYKGQAFFGLFEVMPGLLELTSPAARITIVNAYSDRLVTRLEEVHGLCKIRVYDQLWRLISEETVEGDATGLDLNITGPSSACFSVVVEPCGQPTDGD